MMSTADPECAHAAEAHLADYMTGLITARRDHPSDA